MKEKYREAECLDIDDIAGAFRIPLTFIVAKLLEHPLQIEADQFVFVVSIAAMDNPAAWGLALRQPLFENHKHHRNQMRVVFLLFPPEAAYIIHEFTMLLLLNLLMNLVRIYYVYNTRDWNKRVDEPSIVDHHQHTGIEPGEPRSALFLDFLQQIILLLGGQTRKNSARCILFRFNEVIFVNYMMLDKLISPISFDTSKNSWM